MGFRSGKSYISSPKDRFLGRWSRSPFLDDKGIVVDPRLTSPSEEDDFELVPSLSTFISSWWSCWAKGDFLPRCYLMEPPQWDEFGAMKVPTPSNCRMLAPVGGVGWLLEISRIGGLSFMIMILIFQLKKEYPPRPILSLAQSPTRTLQSLRVRRGRLSWMKE